MDLRIKNALGIVGVAGIALAAVALWMGAGAFARSAPAYATFAVSGQGKAVGVPDVARFSFSVTNEGGKDIAALQRDNTAKANTVIAFLKSEGVDARDIQTQDYSVQPRYQTYNCRPTVIYQGAAGAEPAIAAQPCPPSEIVGYTVSQTVEVKVRDFEKISAIVPGVTAKGANTVSGLDFTVDNPSALQNEARSKAIQDAKMQAEAMARAGGFNLGRLVRVDEGGYMPYYAKEVALDSLGVGGGAPAPVAIEPGSEQTTAYVTLTYEIR
jgi:uncharacterized protein YggE